MNIEDGFSEPQGSRFDAEELFLATEDAIEVGDIIQARVDFIDEIINRGFRNVHRAEDIPSFARSHPDEME